MSRLRIFDENDPGQPLFASSDGPAIAAELEKIGVTFERWQANQPIAPGATPEQVMDAYRADIDRLVAERGFKTVDVVSIAPDNPNRGEMRSRSLRRTERGRLKPPFPCALERTRRRVRPRIQFPRRKLRRRGERFVNAPIFSTLF